MTDTVTGNPVATAYTGPFSLDRPHFVGVGGCAMSGLARLLAESGRRVTGSDIADSPTLEMLRTAGVITYPGHHRSYIEGASCVVYTTVAQGADEVHAARSAGIPVIHRAQAIEALCTRRRLIAVSGSHGKSTTAGVLATALRQLGEDPTYLIGADLDAPGSGARLGKSDLMVVEADESDRSFLFLPPAIAVITNVTDDHPENFATHAELVDSYVAFAERIVKGGVLIVNADDEGAAEVAARIAAYRADLRVLSYGRSGTADYRLTSVAGSGWNLRAEVVLPSGQEVALALSTPAPHHVHNAIAALACTNVLGVGPVAASQAVSTFTGVRRRFENLGTVAGVTVIDSYADHPNEILADLCAARTLTAGQVLVAFQPSGHSRVAAFGAVIGEILNERADHVMLLDVHGTLPTTGPTADAAQIATRLDDDRYTLPMGSKHVAWIVNQMAKPGDVVLTMGTGDVTTYGKVIIDQLAARKAPSQTV
ncbi:UDP-N-acetylmuramate--L-alanine ligase [Micromonospora sp. NPDC049523]|uniref:UDP-N-acetylmuramate--L-alanine ligase n=1 Tax=Micromonospora sp. NPDC049523 TaxID=3155921 RepID=UPI003449DB2A